MVLVAVAGGSSPTLGRSIVTAIQETGEHKAVILSRLVDEKENTTTDTKYNTSVHCVDYTSIESLTAALKGVNVVISVLKIPDPTAMLAQHQTLLEACVAAKVSRFAPADFSMGPLARDQVDLIKHKQQLWQMCTEIGIPNGIECAMFQPGMFMNYLAQGIEYPSTQAGSKRQQQATAGLVDDMMLEYIDVTRGKLLIPLNDEGRPARLSATDIADVGRFVAAAVDLPKGQWNGDLGMVGDTFTMQEVREVLVGLGVQVAEETITKEQCRERIEGFDMELQRAFSVESLIGKMVAQMMLVTCKDKLGGAKIEPKLNQLCSNVQPIAVQDFLKRTYS